MTPIRPLLCALFLAAIAWSETRAENLSAWGNPRVVDETLQRSTAGLPSAGFDGLPIGTVHRVEPVWTSFAEGVQLTLALPGSDPVDIHLHQVSRHGGEHRSLSIHGAPEAPAMGFLTVGPQAMYGKIATRSGRYRIHSDAAGTWLIALDSPMVIEHQGCALNHHHAGFGPVPPGQPASAVRKEPVQIDKMILYTPEIAERYPGSMIDTRMHHLVALTNQAMVDSGLDVVLRLVHYEETDYDRNVSSFVGLVDMRDALRGETIEGFEDLAATRAQYGADLIGMVWAADIETRGACGVTFLPFKPEGEDDYDATLGVQISADGVTNWSVCSDSTFVHEVGHQLGAHHQRESFNPDFLPDTTGFALVVPGRFNTVMSSLSSADVNRFKRLNVYSSPLIQCGGQACGSDEPDAEIHNAEVIAQFAPIIAGYMDSVLPGQQTPPAPSFPDSDGDGLNDWEDPYPFDPFNGEGPEPPAPQPWTPLPRFDGSQLEHWELLIASSGSDQIHAWRLDGTHAGLLIQAEPDGFPDERPAFSEYTRIADHPDGLIYALSSGDVRRFDRLRGRQHDVFLDSQPPTPTLLSGGFPKALLFNQQGQLLISGLSVLEAYDDEGLQVGFTGVTAPEGGFLQPHAVRDFALYPIGDAFLALEALTGRILLYQNPNDFNPITLDNVDAELLVDPWSLALGPDGSLFIANGSAGNVLRVDGASGVASEWIAAGTGGLSFARDLAFGPDEQLYVLDRDQAAVLRFDGQSGDFIDHFIGPNSGQLDQAQSMLFVVRPDIELFRDRFETP